MYYSICTCLYVLCVRACLVKAVNKQDQLLALHGPEPQMYALISFLIVSCMCVHELPFTSALHMPSLSTTKREAVVYPAAGLCLEL